MYITQVDTQVEIPTSTAHGVDFVKCGTSHKTSQHKTLSHTNPPEKASNLASSYSSVNSLICCSKQSLLAAFLAAARRISCVELAF